MSDDNQQQQQQTNTQPPATTPPVTQPKPEGKVWTDEYVTGLRAEAKDHRLTAKKYETQVRSLLGLKPDDELSDALISTFQTNQQKTLSDTMQKANARLLSAEIKSLDGYNAKLVEKLLDRSKVTIGEDGRITGLTEAVTELATEFPEIKTTAASGSGGVNPPLVGGQTEIQKLEEALEKAPNLATRIAIRNQIFALQSKK